MIVADNLSNDQDDRLKEFHQRLLAGGKHTANYSSRRTPSALQPLPGLVDPAAG